MDNDYAGNSLDTYLNETWYGTLTTDAKAAIVPKAITQDSWYRNDSGDPDYTGTYGTSVPGTSNYTISKNGSDIRPIGNRNVYAMSVQEVIDYLNDENMRVDKTAILRNQNIWKMFWNTEAQPSNYTYPWLRSANADFSSSAWYVYDFNGYLHTRDADGQFAARPAFQIDLSKVSWS